jgi:predicted nucleic acid-binding protein
MSRLVLDAGAFVAFERGDVALRAHLHAARRLEMEVVTTAPVVGQVWRDGRKQAQLARLLAATRIDAPGEAAARRAGELMARSRTADVVDALLVGLAAAGDTIATSDPDDIERLLAAARIRATVLTV